MAASASSVIAATVRLSRVFSRGRTCSMRAGGTDIFHMPAGRVKLTAGTDAVRCLQLLQPGLPLVQRSAAGTPHRQHGRPALPGGRAHPFVHERPVRPAATAAMRRWARRCAGSSSAPPPGRCRRTHRRRARSASLHVRLPKLLGWWLRGLGRPNPFFDETTAAPLAAPRMFTPQERAALADAPHAEL